MDRAEKTIESARASLQFRKEERLRHKAFVDRLFESGHSHYAFPLRMVYLLESAAQKASAVKSRHALRSSPEELLKAMGVGKVQMMVTVPKKKQRRAVDRVRLRRLIREAWRLNRTPLKRKIEPTQPALTLSVAFYYMSDEPASYAKIEEKMLKLLAHLAEKVDEAALNSSGHDPE